MNFKRKYVLLHSLAAAGSILGSSAYAQLGLPTGTVFTQHGVYTWGPGPALPIFNIPGNGFMIAPGGGMPIVTGDTPISTSGVAAVGPWLNWFTAAGAGGFPTFGGARSQLRGWSNGAAAGLQWANYFVGDNTPVGVQAGSFNLSGGDITGTVGPLGWTGRTGIYFPFQVRAIKPVGYAALGAAFELEVYNAVGVLQRAYDLGVVVRTDGLGAGLDGIASFQNNILNSPGAVQVGAWRQFWVGPVYTFQGWAGMVTPPITLGPGWTWVINGRLTLVADPDFTMDYFDPSSDPLLAQPEAHELPDMGYATNIVPSGDGVVYKNCNLSTGTSTLSGVAAPAGAEWSETARDEESATMANTIAGFSGSGAFRLADDFTVPSGGATISGVRVYGYTNGITTPAISAATLRILDSSPAGSPTVLFGDQVTNRIAPGSNVMTDIYRIFNTTAALACGGAPTAPTTGRRLQSVVIAVDPPLTLSAGTYWLDYNFTGVAFAPPSTHATAIGRQCNPSNANAIQFEVAWNPLADDGQGCSPTAINQDLYFEVLGTVGGSCYANCDGSTGVPPLTANDFQCFLNKFAANDPYANCDGSTGVPPLTANDFQCFLNKFAAGCS